MALFNYATKELSAKIVYYGPGLSGKTTNIEMVHRLLRPEQKGRLISLPTETDRTLFFDFLPLDLGHIKGFKVRFHLYTVPGQVFYNATRRLVLQGVDGVVFVADSQVDMMSGNVDSLKNLRENLATYGKKLEELPFVLQYNKRDLRNISSVREMNALINDLHAPVFEGIAKNGVGVTETLVSVSRLVFAHLRKTLLLPGDLVEAGEYERIQDVGRKKKSPFEEAEQLEEISDIEEISELVESQEWIAVEETPEPSMPAEVRSEPFGETLPDIGEAVKIQEIPETTEVPEGVELIIPPREVAETSVPGESMFGEGARREEVPPEPEGETGLPPVEVPDEIEIEIPERFDESPPAPDSRPAVSVKMEGEGLTFLKFEDVFVSPEGDAVLPAVFLDAKGNPVRIRIRVSMEEGRD